MNDQIRDLLNGKTVAEKKKAGVLLQKNPSPEFEEKVCEILKKELITRKSWEAICALIKAAGINQYKKVIPILQPIIEENIDHDIITMAAGTAWFRLTRTDLKDIKPLKEKFASIKFSVGSGMLDALGYDRMMPEDQDVKEIIDRFWDFGVNAEPGFMDPRYGLAAACAGWNPAIVDPFLNHCLKAKDSSVSEVAASSLKRKYVKLR